MTAIKLYFTPNSFQKKYSLIAFCKIKTTNRNITKLKSQKRILLRYCGKKSNNPNKSVLSPTKARPISGSAPPYSLRIDFPERMYKNKATKSPKIIYPYGFTYLALDIKIRYIQRNPLAKVNTKTSETNPNKKIFTASNPLKEAWVIG